MAHRWPYAGNGKARTQDVRQGPDGFIYFATDESDGGVYRMEPIE